MNVSEKIIEVKKSVGALNKDSKGYGYNYVSGNQVLSKIKDKMNEVGLLLVPSTEAGGWEKHSYTTKQGKEAIDFVVSGNMKFTWVNAEDPKDTLEVSWAYFGQQDDISKAYGSALTYSERYFLLKALGLPTDEDDPDSKDTRGNSSSSNQVVTEKQLNRLYAISKSKGIDYSKVEARVKEKYGKEVKELSRAEYDEVVKLIEEK